MGNVIATRQRDLRMSQAEPQNEIITLQRAGQQPLRFTGRVLAEVTDELPEYVKAKKDSRRWHELRLFQTEKGKFVLSIGFRTSMELETPRDTVIVCDDLAGVQKALTDEEEGYDPIEFLAGFPNRPQFAERQRKLEDRVIDDFERRVGQLLDKAGAVETLE